MEPSFAPVLRDALVRLQLGALRETGRRTLTYLRSPMDNDLLLPGCGRPGYTFWQPVPWQGGTPDLGENAALFHESIREYLSLCRFLEFRFRLPVSGLVGKGGLLFKRVFEVYPNTVCTPPAQALDEAVLAHVKDDSLPLSLVIASTCDNAERLLLHLRAEDGVAFVTRALGEQHPLDLQLSMEKLLPKLQFVYNI